MPGDTLMIVPGKQKTALIFINGCYSIKEIK
jgi:hypothetical protein